jgi:ABC-type phosphate transport system permease subunit
MAHMVQNMLEDNRKRLVLTSLYIVGFSLMIICFIFNGTAELAWNSMLKNSVLLYWAFKKISSGLSVAS